MIDPKMEPLRGFPVGIRNVAVYLRKSREDINAEQRAMQSGGEYDTLSRHRSALLELAQRQQYNITKIYAEVLSGESINGRPQMQELLKQVEQGSYNAVMCMDIDRLGRGDMRDQGTILATFKQSQTLIITPDKVYDLDDEMDEEMTEFKAFFSRKEYKIIRKRLERGRLTSIRQGKFVYPRAPYGYVLGEIGSGVLQVHPEQSKIVQLIFRWYIAGMGPTNIAHRLMTLKIPSPLGKSNWWPEQIIFMLRNPVYQGQIRHGHQQRHRAKKRPTEIYEGLHDAIIDRESFEEVQKMIGKPTAPGPKRPKNPLRGLVYCGYCGKSYQWQPARGLNAFERIQCRTMGCQGGSLNIDTLEDVMLDQLRSKYDQLVVTPEQPAPDRSVIEVIENQIKEVSAGLLQTSLQRTNAFDLLEQGVYSVEVFEERQRALSDRQEEFEKQLVQLETEIEIQEQLFIEHDSLLPRFIKVLDLYRKLDHPDLKNELLREVVDRMIIFKEKSSRGFDLQIYLRMPVEVRGNS